MRSENAITLRTDLSAMLRSAILTALLAAAPSAHAQLVWAQQVSSTSPDYAFSAAVDADGVLVGGRVTFDADLDGDGAADLTTDGIEAYAARYTADGALVWAAGVDDELSPLSSEDRAHVASDGAGGAFLAGRSRGAVDFRGDGSPAVPGLGDRDGYVARFDAAGALVWGVVVGSDRDDDLTDAAAVGAGGLVAVGRFRTGGDFDGDGQPDLTAQGTSDNSAGNDAFIVRYDASGAIVWARSVSGPNNDTATGVAVDDAGRVTVTGTFRLDTDFDNDGVPDATADFATAYVAQYEPDGALRWVYVRPVGGGNVGTRGVSSDGAGGAFVTGQYSGSPDFDGDGVPDATSAVGSHAFLLRLDAAGDVVWVASTSGDSFSGGYRAAPDGSGGAYVVGFFEDAVDFDGDGTNETMSAGASDGFLARYDASGTLDTVTRIGAGQIDEAYDVVADGAGELVVVGGFRGAIDLDGDGTDDLDGIDSDGFVARLVGVPVAAEAAPAAGLALSVAPNPSAGRAAVRLELDAPGEAAVTVFDALGRRVAALHRGPLGAGDHAWALPALAPGLYVVRAATSEGGAVRPLSIVR